MPEDAAFHSIPGVPARICAAALLVRLVDGLGFRFRWATEGLTESDTTFRPSPASMSIGELVEHVWGLVNWVSISVSGIRSEKPAEFPALRIKVLDMLTQLRADLSARADADLQDVTIDGLPFWHIVNGPLSDALTHVGQINAFRRLAGNPTPRANVFLGVPPG
jgi:hypothetical protein